MWKSSRPAFFDGQPAAAAAMSKCESSRLAAPRVMKISTFYHIIAIILFVSWMSLPLCKGRVRARWANFACVACGLLGIAEHIICLIVETHPPPYNSDTIYGIYAMHNAVEGLLLGFFLSLIFSGEMAGKASKSGDNPSLLQG